MNKPILLILFLGLLLIPIIALTKEKTRTRILAENSEQTATASAGFVTRVGTQFMLDGAPFKFVGFNFSNAAANDEIFNCGKVVLTDEAMDTMFSTWKNSAGVGAVRIIPRQKYFVRPDGTFNWSAMDRFLNFADTYDIKVIATLEDNNGYCTVWGNDGPPLWQHNGGEWWNFVGSNNPDYKTYKYFTSPNQYQYSFYDYVSAIVNRYKDNPNIMAWEVINEGTCGANCGGAIQKNFNALYNVAETYTSLIKSIDPNHLVTFGTQGKGSPGVSIVGGCSSQHSQVHDLPSVDYGQSHDYNHETEPIWGSADGVTLPDPASCNTDQSLACGMSETLNCSGKPHIIGEAGIRAPLGSSGCGITFNWTYEQRAELIGKKMDAHFNAGGSGFLVWAWDSPTPNLGCGYSVTSTADPLIAVMKAHENGVVPVPSPTATPSATPTPTPTPITDQLGPVTEITFPLNGTTVPAGGTIDISASATDVSGVSKVEFFLNGSLKCTDLAAPYLCKWKVPAKVGTSYTIEAKGFDSVGNTALATSVVNSVKASAGPKKN